MSKEKRNDDLFGPRYHQTICLTGRERAYTIHNYEVNIHASPSSSLDSSAPGSNKVQVSTITNQNWELPTHPGNMVACNLNYIAYVLEGRSGYVLRLIHRQSNDRTLLKGFTGPVLDVAFVPAGSSNLLACVDQGGNLFIWDLNKCSTISDANSTLQLHSKRSSTPDHVHHRLSWCPYVPQEEGEEEEDGCMIALSHGCEVEVYNLGLLLPTASDTVVLQQTQEVQGRFTIPSPHDKPLLDLSLSPDAGVLATSSEDGHLKFWQVNWDDTVPSTSLHDFSPHRGEPVSRLIFCDNHTTQDPLAQFWRFLITGANNNTEVKLWCTVSWRCLQTVRFLPPQDTLDSATPNILLDLDISASYLLATDTRRMTLYVFQLVTDGLAGQASLTAITEYLLTQPILSFDISGHTPCPTNNETGESGEEEEEKVVLPDGLELDSRLKTVVISLHCIHTRSMQELQVKYEPPDLMGAPPDPLPVPLFSGDMFSSEPTQPKSQDKPSSATAATQNGEKEEEEERWGEEEEEEKGEEEEEEEEVEENIEEEEEEEEEEEDGGPPPLEVATQPASLPSSLLPSTTTAITNLPSPLSEGFHSLPSLPGVSPKLVTPSAFLSAAKIDISPSMSASSPPPPLSDASPSASRPRPQPHRSSLPSAFDTSILSTSSVNTLTSVTPSDTLLDLGGPWEGEGEEQGGKRGEGAGLLDKDETKEEKLIDDDLTVEEQGEGEGENTLVELLEDKKQLSAVEEVPPGELSQLPRSSAKVDREREPDATREKFSDIFGLAEPLEAEGVYRPSPVRPQQIFTSTDKSEIVVIPRNSITPTREEGTEVVNTTGTPSAEYMEMFSQTPKRGSKVTTPQGQGNNEMTTSYGLPAPAWMDKITGSAASAWPDVGLTGDVPKLVPREEFETEGPGYISGAPAAEGTGSEVTEVGQARVNGEELEPSREVNETGMSSSFGGLFPSAHGTPKMEPAFPVLNVSETTEGETGQTLPATAEQPFPTTHDLLAPASVIVGEQEGEEEGEEAVGGGREMDVKARSVEESTGVATARLVEIVPSSSPPPHLEPPLRGGVASSTVKSGKGRRKRSRSKQHTAAVTATSDGEPAPDAKGPLARNHLTPSPTLLISDGAESVGMADHTHLAKLYQLVTNQQQEIAALRTEQQMGFATLHQQFQELQRSSIDEQRGVLAEHAREQQQRVDRILKDKQALDRQRQDKLISTVSQTLTSAVHAKLEKVVKTEVKNQVTPAVSRSLAGIQEQLSSTVQQRLTATDTALRDGITHILHSKGLPEAVGSAVAGSIRNTIQSQYDEVFRAVVLPAFERSTQEMFRQVDDAFRRGINEYLSQLQQQFHQLSDPTLQHLTTSHHSLHSLLTSSESPLLTALQHEIRSATQSTIRGVGEGVRGVVREEVEAVLQRHASTVDPETQAREERARKQGEIQRLLQSQDINRAFETALSTADLSLVLYLCQQVTLEEVFDKTPCPLSQPVLLSLIQQFSVDISDNVDLKLRYLEASVLALDVNNDITKNHMTQVLRMLTQQLSIAEQLHRNTPNSASLLRLIKRLRMVTERLCHSHSQ